ncbi:MAG: nucleotide exchange factor GrpE [Thermodesulfobacteriota bacterium]|nr:nucleotide exchange factor GrpE [Thermodesulfobacteriota bacterium]
MSKKKNPAVKESESATDAVTAEIVNSEDGSEELSVEECLQEELAKCRDEVEVHKDLYLRTRAETDNFKRRMQREKEELSKYANEALLREVLPVIDNLERAVAHARDNDGDTSTLLDGVEMTLGQFQNVLQKFHVTSVDAKGKLFDTACHEAMGQMERDDCEPNTVVDVMQSGYMLNGRLLRPAMVMVSKAVAEVKDDASKSI